jgi:5-(carboxyamino)imidazole ribonucleotide mutase
LYFNAKNAGILAAQIIANEDNIVREKVAAFRVKQTQDVLDNPNPAIFHDHDAAW